MGPLTFPDLVAVLRDGPLPASGVVAYSLPLSPAQMAELVPLLQDARGLRGLRLRGCKLDDAAAEQLSRAVAFGSLEHLDLRDNLIDGCGASYLANALRCHCYTLVSLDLSGNPAIVSGPEALQEIALLLSRNARAIRAAATAAEASPGKALVRFEEVAPHTPTGAAHLAHSPAELEQRLLFLEHGVEQVGREVGGLREAAAAWGDYRAALDQASEQMALVLEMLQADVAGIKLHLAEPQAPSGGGGTDKPAAAAAVAQLRQHCEELQHALDGLQAGGGGRGSSGAGGEEAEGGGGGRGGGAAVKRDIGLLVDAVRLLEEKVERLGDCCGGAAVAAHEAAQQAALALSAANKAGAEAEVVAESLRGASGAISALQGEVGAATAAAQGARQQASGAAAAVAALEQQVLDLRLSYEAMEQALDGADVAAQLAAVQAQLGAMAARAAAAEQAAQQATEALAALQARELEGVRQEAAAQLAELAAESRRAGAVMEERLAAVLQAAQAQGERAAAAARHASTLEAAAPSPSSSSGRHRRRHMASLRHQSAAASRLASFPLAGLGSEAEEREEEEEAELTDLVGDVMSVSARLAAQAQQVAALEALVQQQAEALAEERRRQARVEAELAGLHKTVRHLLLASGSGGGGGAFAAACTTPASSPLFFDADSVLGDPSPSPPIGGASAARSPWLEATPPTTFGDNITNSGGGRRQAARGVKPSPSAGQQAAL